MNFILGSGLIGNVAKRMMGDSWGWLPFKRSRYYSADIPYADNFILYDKVVDDFMREYNPNVTPLFVKRPISYQGMLMYQDLPVTQDPYLRKIYGDDVPPLASTLLRTAFSTYQLTPMALLRTLESKQKEVIDASVRKYGEVVEIDLVKKIITYNTTDFGLGKVEFDKLISTIPLNALYRLCKLTGDLKARSVCYYQIATDAVDLEGAEYALVADLDIKFYKVYQIKKFQYVFCTFEPLENPLQYFGSILNYKIDIVDARRIEDALPLYSQPDLAALKDVFCVGSNAQWDDFMDVSSCIKRLLSYAAR
jgi:hypothetical protein